VSVKMGNCPKCEKGELEPQYDSKPWRMRCNGCGSNFFLVHRQLCIEPPTVTLRRFEAEISTTLPNSSKTTTKTVVTQETVK
jgi:hypothetical protein